ncbi:MAG: sigma-70 family RNA polymerase sigma factor [Phycisphaerae bacterium]|nr:sigma-70 family RNA polymerase sigma factor [Phycisphaerae bacterium]
MRKYKNKAMEELAAELCSGLLRLRKGYLDAAEELLRLVGSDQAYPYDFVVYRLTGYRPPKSQATENLLEGRSLRSDLLQAILDISASFDLSTRDYDEAVYDSAALAKQFKISTKTIQRWRARGLPARRMYFPDGKRRVAFLERSVSWFFRQHASQVQRSTKFSQLTSEERQDILRRARRMASFTQCNMGDVVRRLARRTGRVMETIRYTIRRHDKEHPDDAIFPRLLHSLGDMEKRRIYRSFLQGYSAVELAREFHRTRSSIYRIVNELRAIQLLKRPISYVDNEQFSLPDAEKTILAAHKALKSKASGKTAGIRPPRDLPPYLQSLYKMPLLKAENERDLFCRYNFFKYKADMLRQTIDLRHVRASQVKQVESYLLRANSLKNQIVRANLRLVVSIAKKHISGPLSLFELISDGNISLMRAVEKFDFARGFRFSTYASWAIMRNFARSVPKERYQLDRFSTGHEEVLDIAAGLRSYNPMSDNPAELRESIDVLLSRLSQREQIILTNHYGLDEYRDAKTFEQLGKMLGISKERVRQIEIQALEKLRQYSTVHEHV